MEKERHIPSTNNAIVSCHRAKIIDVFFVQQAKLIFSCLHYSTVNSKAEQLAEITEILAPTLYKKLTFAGKKQVFYNVFEQLKIRQLEVVLERQERENDRSLQAYKKVVTDFFIENEFKIRNNPKDYYLI